MWAKRFAVAGGCIIFLRGLYSRARREIIMENDGLSAKLAMTLSNFEANCVYFNLTSVGWSLYRPFGGKWMNVPERLWEVTPAIPKGSSMKATDTCQAYASFLLANLQAPVHSPDLPTIALYVIKNVFYGLSEAIQYVLSIPGYSLARLWDSISNIRGSTVWLIYLAIFTAIARQLNVVGFLDLAGRAAMQGVAYGMRQFLPM